MAGISGRFSALASGVAVDSVPYVLRLAPVAEHLAATRGLPGVPVQTPYRSTWLDNSKAKFLLDWRPQYDMTRLVDESYGYERAAAAPRKIWSPG